MTTPTVILFDLGNVLVSIHPEAFLKSLGIATPENYGRYQAPVIEIVKRYERGEDSTEGYLNRLQDLFDGRFDHNNLTRAMLCVIGQPVDGMERLVGRVAASRRVAMLSNTNPLHYEFSLKRVPALQLIPLHFLSYKLKSLKPESVIFEKMLNQLGVEASRVLFIDDLEENINAARAVGIQGMVFRSLPQLESELSELKIV